jgi:hypothetical protein
MNLNIIANKYIRPMAASMPPAPRPALYHAVSEIGQGNSAVDRGPVMVKAVYRALEKGIFTYTR